MDLPRLVFVDFQGMAYALFGAMTYDALIQDIVDHVGQLADEMEAMRSCELELSCEIPDCPAATSMVRITRPAFSHFDFRDRPHFYVSLRRPRKERAPPTYKQAAPEDDSGSARRDSNDTFIL